MALAKTRLQPPTSVQAVVAVAIDPPECIVAAVEVPRKVAAGGGASG